MTKKQALSQLLTDETNSDWLLPDFLNLDVVQDENFNKSIRVNNLSEIQAKIALGIVIHHIKKQNKILKQIRNLTHR